MLHLITDFIGIFFEWIAVGKKMSLKTPSGKVRNFDTNSKNCKAQYTKKITFQLIVHVEKAISQVCHQDFIEMVGLPYCATVSFKDLQMEGDVFSCFNDTIIKLKKWMHCF